MLERMGEHGQGTIIPEGPPREAGSPGPWRVAVTMSDGRRVYRRVRGTWKAAEKVRRELVEMRLAELDPSSRTLSEWLRSWVKSLRDAKRQRVRPRTLDHYNLIIERHIIPALGNRKLGTLSERHVQAWLDADPAAARTIHHHRAVLRRALNVALRQRVVSRNVALAVELPDADTFAGTPLTIDEARALLAATAGDRLGPLWRLALDSGCRQGELLGLGWTDFSEQAGAIAVTAQLVRVAERHDAAGKVVREGAWARVPTKSARESETITLMSDTVAALAAHKLKMGAERTADWKYAGHVFVTSTGQPYHGAEILKAFKGACRKAGIAERRFHDLRASTATILRELGVPEDVRMARLGHTTKRMARHYAQAREGYDREAVEAFAKALAG